MALIRALSSVGGDGGIDVTNFTSSTSVTSVNSGSYLDFTVTQKPRYIFVTYLYTTANIYVRNDLIDVEKGKVFKAFKRVDSTSYEASSANVTDEYSYSGTTLSVKNMTNATRYMAVVAFY